jgi:hypothetical protein
MRYDNRAEVLANQSILNGLWLGGNKMMFMSGSDD